MRTKDEEFFNAWERSRARKPDLRPTFGVIIIVALTAGCGSKTITPTVKSGNEKILADTGTHAKAAVRSRFPDVHDVTFTDDTVAYNELTGNYEASGKAVYIKDGNKVYCEYESIWKLTDDAKLKEILTVVQHKTMRSGLRQ